MSSSHKIAACSLLQNDGRVVTCAIHRQTPHQEVALERIALGVVALVYDQVVGRREERERETDRRGRERGRGTEREKSVHSDFRGQLYLDTDF